MADSARVLDLMSMRMRGTGLRRCPFLHMTLAYHHRLQATHTVQARHVWTR